MMYVTTAITEIIHILLQDTNESSNKYLGYKGLGCSSRLLVACIRPVVHGVDATMACAARETAQAAFF